MESNSNLDSGCTQHMTHNESLVQKRFQKNMEVSAAMNQKVITEYAGTVKLETMVGSEISNVTLSNTLIVSNL